MLRLTLYQKEFLSYVFLVTKTYSNLIHFISLLTPLLPSPGLLNSLHYSLHILQSKKKIHERYVPYHHSLEDADFSLAYLQNLKWSRFFWFLYCFVFLEPFPKVHLHSLFLKVNQRNRPQVGFYLLEQLIESLLKLVFSILLPQNKFELFAH